MRINWKLSGKRAVIEALDMAHDEIRKAVGPVLKVSALRLKQSAKSLAPIGKTYEYKYKGEWVGSGHLQESIMMRGNYKKLYATVGTPVEYARFVEFGGTFKGGRGKGRQFTVKARPYLYKAAKQVSPGFQAAILAIVRNVERKFNYQQALSQKSKFSV